MFIEGSLRRELKRRLASGKFQFEQESGEIENFEDQDVLRKWSSGKWVIDEVTLGSASEAFYLATPRDLSTYSLHRQEEARRRERYLRHIDPENTPYNPDRWRKLIEVAAGLMSDQKPPAPSTVHGWWKKFRPHKSITALVTKGFGGRAMETDPRFSIFEEAISEVYLTGQRLPKIVVYNTINKKIAGLNAGREPILQIKPLGRSTTYRWLESLRQDIVDASRLGAEASTLKYRSAMGSPKVREILERVEIDHTPLDIIVIHKETMIPMGRPWMTLALDRYSRMIVGFYISFNAPSSHSVLQCLRRSILPKSDWLDRFSDIQGEWPACGIMDEIAVDNGMDLHSEAVQKSCQEMGIDPLFCPVATPQFKGAVERCFRTLAEGLIHRLPGTVFSSIDQRGDYPAEKLAAIDLETLVYVIVRWIVDIYSVSHHRGIGTTPLLKWKESAQRRLIDLPAYPEQLAVITGIPATRTLFHYGIELEGLHYNSTQLQEIRRHAGVNKKVPLKFSDETVEYIYVYDERKSEYLTVPAINSDYAENLPRGVHRLIREHARRSYGENCSTAQMEEAREAIQNRIRASIDFKKMATRKQAATLIQADSEAVLAKVDPLSEARKPLKTAAVPPPEDLPSGLDDALPSFRAVVMPVKSQGALNDAT